MTELSPDMRKAVRRTRGLLALARLAKCAELRRVCLRAAHLQLLELRADGLDQAVAELVASEIAERAKALGVDPTFGDVQLAGEDSAA